MNLGGSILAVELRDGPRCHRQHPGQRTTATARLKHGREKRDRFVKAYGRS